MYFPQDGWVEHDAEEIWDGVRAVCRAALKSAGIAAADLAGIGITTQRETTVVWDRKTGEPVYNAIVWQDRRTADACARLKAEGAEAMVRGRTGLVLDPYFSGTKVAWILDNVDGARARAERGELAFGTLDSWLVYQLTEGRLHLTDPSNASRTLLFGLRSGEWDDEMLRLLRVPRSVLPEVRASSEVYGSATVAGLRDVPIAGIAGTSRRPSSGKCARSPA